MRSPSTRTRASSSSPNLQSKPVRRTSSQSANLHRRASAPAVLPSAQTVDNGLAICLFGVSSSSKMYDAEFEEDRRRRVVMQEVLPDAEMWRKWEKNEAPLRQGRGWYPALDRHFLELLVISEIATLSNPLNAGGPPGQAERVHRHAVRVRRVACDRIGQERLGAYCDRVKEAFEAYVSAPVRGGAGCGGGWGVSEEDVLPSPMTKWGANDDGEEDDDGDEGRGRRLEREGSAERESSENRGPDRTVGGWGEGAGESSLAEVSMKSADSGSESDDEASTSDISTSVDLFMDDIDLALPLLPPVLALTGETATADAGAEEMAAEDALPSLSPTSDSDTESVVGSLWGGCDVSAGVRIELGDLDEREEDVEMAEEKAGPIGALAEAAAGYVIV